MEMTMTQTDNNTPAVTFSDRAALMVEKGIPVVRLYPLSKEPIDTGWQNRATTDLDQIAAWDQETPSANCGVVAKADADGFLFFEADEPNVLRRFEQATGEHFETFAVQSRPGRIHHYFKQTLLSRKVGSITQAKLKFGTLRQHNAYVVGPLSIHPITGEPYKIVRDVEIIPIPDSFLNWLVSQTIETSKSTGPTTPYAAPGETVDVDAAIENVFANGVTIASGGRNSSLTSIAGVLRNLGLESEEIFEHLQTYNEKFCQPPLGQGEVKTISYSIGKTEVYNREALTPLIGGKLAGATVVSATTGAVPDLVESVAEDGIEVDRPINLTEVGNARRLIQSHGKNLRFCVDDQRWRAYTGSVWTIDKEEIVKLWMKAVLSDIQRQTENIVASAIPELVVEALRIKTTKDGNVRANELLSEEEQKWFFLFKKAQSLKSWALASESNQKIFGSVAQARNEPPMPAADTDFDQNRLVCNLKNGTLEFSPENVSFTMRPHVREDYCTRMAPVDYVEGADCPEFKKFLNWMFGDDQEIIRYIQSFFGLCLTGRIDRIVLILWGDGANGKGTLMTIVSRILGMDRSGYGHPVAFSTFAAAKEEKPGSPRADLLALNGPRLIVASESNKKKTRLDTALLKNFTGGDATNTRGMYAADVSTFLPQGKVLLQTNNLPVVDDDSDGFWERTKLIACLKQMPPEKQDKHLADKIVAKEASGILNFFIEGLMNYFRRQNQGLSGFEVPKAVEASTAVYRGEENHMGRFVADRCEIKKLSFSTLSSAVYQSYLSWCRDCGEEPESNMTLTQFITKRHKVERKHTREGSHLAGLVLKPTTYTAQNVSVIINKSKEEETDPTLFESEEVPM